MTWLQKILIGIGALVLLMASFVIGGALKERRIRKQQIEITESEMRFKQLVKEAKVKEAELARKDSVIDRKQALIDFLENNPQIIIQNNAKEHLDIDRLNAYNSILRFTNGAADYESHRHRYDLDRINKNR